MSRLVFGLFVLVVLSVVSGVRAQDVETARAAFARGVSAYEAEDYETALGAFQEAYRAAPHPTVLVNIANCYEQLERPVAALENYQRFLDESETIAPAQRAAVDEAMVRLRPQVGWIAFDVQPAGAELMIDGYQRLESPVSEPFGVLAGFHRVEISRQGYEPQTLEIEVGGAQTESLAVRLEPTPEPVEAPPIFAEAEIESRPVEPEPSSSADEEMADEEELFVEETSSLPAQTSSGGGFRISGGAWALGAVTLAAGIGAGVTGGLAIAADGQVNASTQAYYDEGLSLEERDAAGADARAQADDARTLALVSDILVGVTAAGAVATVIVLATTQGEDDEDVQVRLGPGSLEVAGQF